MQPTLYKLDKVLGKILFKGLSKQGLYPIPFDLPLNQSAEKSTATQATTSPQATAFVGKHVKHSLWHQRFGHPSNDIVRAMLNKCNIHSVGDIESAICEPCLLGKFKKLPFPKSQTRSQVPFELMHSDVWGPAPYFSLDGFRYFVLFIDDCTRFTWIFPMRNKNEVFSYFQSLCALVVTQFSTKIKCLRSDGGGEYMSLKFKEYMSNNGIIHQISCPYTPEQNGICERKNRHIRESAVTLLQAASLPSQFWYHACAISTFLINRMPTSTLNMQSPFEMLYHCVPALDLLRVFGCACYPLLTSRSNKLQPKTVRCVFVGFAAGYKGYICYCPATRKYIISRHVFFEESCFPYASVKNKPQSNISSTPQLNSDQALTQSLMPTHLSSSSSASSTPGQLIPSEIISSDSHDDLVTATPTLSHATNILTNTTNDTTIAQSVDNQFHQFVDNAPDISIPVNNDASISCHAFDSHADTAIHFEESNGNLSVQAQPGGGSISVTLDCLPSRPAYQVSDANILHPIAGISPTSDNAHPMVTRSKRGIFKKKCYLSIMHTTSDDPSDFEPSSYKVALNIPVWRQAMQEEYDALMKQQTWSLVPLPPNKNLVSCKWLFKIKRNADGSVARHKARLVARGFSQEYGIDYDETFSPVVRHTTVRLILAYAACAGWSLHQLDVKNAFLHGILTEEVYMSQPGGFEDPFHSSHVCKLHKSLYGLKQAPRAWNERFTAYLPSLDFTPSYADPSLFVKIRSKSIVYLLLYVDDIIITGNCELLILEIKSALQLEFDMKDLGHLHYFLGLEITYLQTGGIFVSQQKYATDLIHKAGLDCCHTHLTPCQAGVKLIKDMGKELNTSDSTHFRSLVGCLQYLTFTRPDIAYGVNSVCQFMHNPSEDHLIAAKRILRYVKGTLEYGICFKRGANTTVPLPLSLQLQAFCDADWAGDPNDRKSTTGFVILLDHSPVSWCSKKQSSVSRSSTEAEYRSMADTTSELMWLSHLLHDLHITLSDIPTLHCDNISALALATNPVYHSKLKHIEVDVHFTRDQVKAGTIKLQFVSSKEQLADLFTKGLGSSQHQYLCDSLKLMTHLQAEEGY